MLFKIEYKNEFEVTADIKDFLVELFLKFACR